MKATAIAPSKPAVAMARKFCSSGSFNETSTPIRIGARIAPVRPIPEAKPTPVERMAVG